METEPDYEIKAEDKAGIGRAGKVGLGLVLAAVIGFIGYPIIAPQLSSVLETSESQEFQDEQDGSRIGRVEPGEATDTQQPAFDIGPLTDQLDQQRAALEGRNAELAGQVAALQAQLRGIADEAAAESNSMAQQLADALQRAQAQNAEAVEQLESSFQNKLAQSEADAAKQRANQKTLLEELQKQNADLAALVAAGASNAQDAELERLRLQVEADRQRREDEAAAAIAAEEQRTANQREQERLSELRAAREAQRALMEARVKSASVVFDEGSSSEAGGQPTAAGSPDAGPQSPDQRNREFVSNGGVAAPVTQAELIANPANTVLQGTMIQATLENAVDSSLPGAVTAMVSYPVYSFDGTRELIPPGSLLIGQYSSDVSLGQARILVGWTRIVTPDGQSVQISAFGGDDQGRSGITGRVNTRFGQRFGGAALISLIGAAPGIAASSSSNEVSSETAENVADNFTSATANIVNEYASLPPIIAVEQGAQITVMVDRDLEFF